MRKALAGILSFVAVGHVGSTAGQGPDTPTASLKLLVSGMVAPVALVEPPDGTRRLFIVDQVGKILILMPDGTLRADPFLDVSARMVTLRPQYDERGLLSLAFHPNYATNGRFFIYYSAPLRPGGPTGWDHTSHLSEFRVSPDPNIADPDSERVVMQIDQPQRNHNGATILFGPEGYLYLSLGDGGAANDRGLGHAPEGNGQNLNTLLGKIIRVDVDHGVPYAVPPDNPFVGRKGLDEIYAYGFRNPYRMSFASDGRLFVGDVGQNLYEEVDIVSIGGNYGWRIREGFHCFDPDNPNNPPPSCQTVGHFGEPLLDPIIEYAHPVVGGIGLTVIGGFVYRGSELPQFRGRYIFGDWSTSFTSPDGSLFVAKQSGHGNDPWRFQTLYLKNRPDGRLNHYLLGFGEDMAGEIYVLVRDILGPSGTTGRVYKLVRPGRAG